MKTKAITLIVVLLMAVSPLVAHEAPSGLWTYPSRCCSSADCDIVLDQNPKIGQPTLSTRMHGTVPIPHSKWQILEQSGDNSWHLCAKLDKSYVYCLFAPFGS